MADAANPRIAIHSWWSAFVPSAVFLCVYFAIFLLLVGPGPVRAVVTYFVASANTITTSTIAARLEKLELLKLLPIIAVFAMALLLYLFDRTALGLGHAIPPYPYWSGTSLAYLSINHLRSLWRLSPAETHFGQLDEVAWRLVEKARAENRSRLLGRLDYLGERFSSAANLFSYAKGGVIWSVFCAVWALRLHQPVLRVLGVWFLVAFIASVALLVSLALETHYFLESSAERVRIATTMLSVEGMPPTKSEDRWDDLEREKADYLQYQKQRFVRLSWGSLEPLQRIVRTFRRGAKPGVAADTSRRR